MKNILYLVLCIVLFTGESICAQGKDTWTAIWNKDSTLVGYKNKAGVTKIEPKFTPFFSANKFDHIIAVTEETEGKWNSYYLTKKGKIVGRDSLHVFDNGYDCESEGFIRFRDPKTDKTGLFNQEGTIVVPAEYNELTRVNNGMVIALKGAEKKIMDGGEHYSYVGGEELLIDTQNHVLVAPFSYDTNINFFSVERSKAPSVDKIRDSFLGKDGSYYSFINFEKEFKEWFTNDLIVSLTDQKLIAASVDTITWESKDGWAKTNRKKLITDNFKLLKKAFSEVINPKCDYFITSDGLNPFMFEDPEYETYFNNCNEAKQWQYPTMSIIVNHPNKKNNSQNNYTFLRTENGYKLITVTIRDEKIKG